MVLLVFNKKLYFVCIFDSCAYFIENDICMCVSIDICLDSFKVFFI